MKALLPLFLLLGISVVAMAQKSGVQIKGTVIESNQQQPIEFATIMVGDKQTKNPITGTTTDLDGNFQLQTDATDFFIEISFIGYATQTITAVSYTHLTLPTTPYV